MTESSVSSNPVKTKWAVARAALVGASAIGAAAVGGIALDKVLSHVEQQVSQQPLPPGVVGTGQFFYIVSHMR